MINVFVTGAGGDIGLGIGRILKESKIANKIYGCDLHNDHIGTQIFDKCVVVPRAGSSNYAQSIIDQSRRLLCDAVILTSEAELRYLINCAKDSEFSKLPLVLANHKSMEIGFDKLKTANFISELGIPSLWTKLVSEGGPINYPCILKSRYGAGNQSVFLVETNSKEKSYRDLYPDYIWQEFVPGENNEYTCGVYGDENGHIRTLILKRRLASGVTCYGELVEDKAIESVCATIGRALELRGSINVQLRIGPRGPMVFEINPRFSSTVMFRHKVGFTDVIWSLQEQILHEKTSYISKVPFGSSIYRTSGELIVPK